MALSILIAPSGFKENLSPEIVADCIEEGVLRVVPDANIQKMPLVDGGEGFTRTLTSATGGTLHSVVVTGPVGQPVEGSYGLLGGSGPRTAVLEMASAAGLRLVPEGLRNPLNTTTYGVGELIKAVLDAGAERIVIGCGDSGTIDGGAGMAQALGVGLLDGDGNPIGWGGKQLLRLEQIDLSGIDSRLQQVKIDVACNFNSVLCGPNGAARLFGPQKGTSPCAVALLAKALNHYASVIQRELDIDVRSMPGGGAAGGLGTGLRAFLKANLHHRYEIVLQYLDLDTPLSKADLVITGEGCIDFSTALGKIPCEVARRAKLHDLPVIAIVGMVGQGAEAALEQGVDSFTSIADGPMQLSAALYRSPELLKKGTEHLMRNVLIGKKLQGRHQNSEDVIDHSNVIEPPEAAVPALFLSELSQDLRTPLSLVIAYSKMIKDGLLGTVSSSQDKALDQVIKYSYCVLTMINGLLDSVCDSDLGQPVKQINGTLPTVALVDEK